MHRLAPNGFRGGRIAGLLAGHRRLPGIVGLLVVLVLIGVVVFAIGGRAVNGTAVARDDWVTLSNAASGLSYRIPPGSWRTKPTIGTVGTVELRQGAYRSPYTCGSPAKLLWRGLVGSGSAPDTDPAALAATVARAAATGYYGTGAAPPRVQVAPARPLTRRTANGLILPGVVVTATVSQHADPCVASQGEVQVFVLRFADHDGVLVVNADLAGGPTEPGPGTDDELRAIVDSARPTGG